MKRLKMLFLLFGHRVSEFSLSAWNGWCPSVAKSLHLGHASKSFARWGGDKVACQTLLVASRLTSWRWLLSHHLVVSVSSLNDFVKGLIGCDLFQSHILANLIPRRNQALVWCFSMGGFVLISCFATNFYFPFDDNSVFPDRNTN